MRTESGDSITPEEMFCQKIMETVELKKEFFQEADKAIEKFDSVYEFFKTAKSHNCNYREVCRFCRNRSIIRVYERVA